MPSHTCVRTGCSLDYLPFSTLSTILAAYHCRQFCAHGDIHATDRRTRRTDGPVSLSPTTLKRGKWENSDEPATTYPSLCPLPPAPHASGPTFFLALPRKLLSLTDITPLPATTVLPLCLLLMMTSLPCVCAWPAALQRRGSFIYLRLYC